MMKKFNNLSLRSKFYTNMFSKSIYMRFSSNITSESFAFGTNAVYIESLYYQWLEDPNSVDISWRNYFSNIDRNLEHGTAYQSPPTIDPSKKSY